MEVHRVLGHFQAEDAEQELGFFVEGAEVLQYVGVEGGAIGAHLQITAQLEAPPPTTPVRGQRSREGEHTNLADIRHLSRFVVRFHVVQEGGLILKGPLTYTTHA